MRRLLHRTAVVVAVLGALIFGTVAVGAVVTTGLMVWSHRNQQRDRSSLRLRGIAAAAELFAQREGRCPSALDELKRSELVTPDALTDAWGHAMVLEAWRGGLTLFSLGSDGRVGGADDDADTSVKVPCPR